MPGNRPLGPADGLSRSIAITGIGFGFLLGAYPLLMIIRWLIRGDSFDAGLVQETLEFTVPTTIQTASTVLAIKVLRTRDPVHSRQHSQWQPTLFGLGVGSTWPAFAVNV